MAAKKVKELITYISKIDLEMNDLNISKQEFYIIALTLERYRRKITTVLLFAGTPFWD